MNRTVIVDDQWVVMNCNGCSVVFDLDMWDDFAQRTWTLSNLYAVDTFKAYMHRDVMKNAPGIDDANLSVDHINRIKMDNRRANMRIVDQAEQNRNRFARCDKERAGDELVAHGIVELPRGIRRDKTLGRYTCGDHEACRGKNSNGTRHKDSSEAARFKDCLEVFIAHLEADPFYKREEELSKEKSKLLKEFVDIVMAAHAFDPEMPTFEMIDEDIIDDLTYARACLTKLADVRVVRGAANMDSHDVEDPNGLVGAVARIKGGTVTLYDSVYKDHFADKNWEVEGVAPRLNKVPLGAYVYTVLAGRTIPPGHVVAPVSRMPFDVRLENLEVIEGRQAYRVVAGDHVVPDGVDAGARRFLPKGVTINNTKVMISQAGRLVPDEHGANSSGLWVKSLTKQRDNVGKLVSEAIVVLKNSHGPETFERMDSKYQRLLGDYMDVLA